MEEKTRELHGQQEVKPAQGNARDRAGALFRQWESEGLKPADMYKRVSDLYDNDPQGAEEIFGGNFMDAVDYFTHYWV